MSALLQHSESHLHLPTPTDDTHIDSSSLFFSLNFRLMSYHLLDIPKCMSNRQWKLCTFKKPLLCTLPSPSRYAPPKAFPISVNDNSIRGVAQAQTRGVTLLPLSLKPHMPYIRSPVGFWYISPLPHIPSYHSCQDYCSSPKVSLPPSSLLPR